MPSSSVTRFTIHFIMTSMFTLLMSTCTTAAPPLSGHSAAPLQARYKQLMELRYC